MFVFCAIADGPDQDVAMLRSADADREVTFALFPYTLGGEEEEKFGSKPVPVPLLPW